MPMGYSYGLSILNTHLYKGAKIVLNKSNILEKKFWEKIRKHKVNSFGFRKVRVVPKVQVSAELSWSLDFWDTRCSLRYI